VSITDNRSQMLARLRKGGAATVTVVRPDTPIANPAGVVAVGDAGAVSKSLGGDAGGEDAWSVKQMQAMIGSAKAKDTVTVAGKRGVTETLVDGTTHANATLVFFGCEDCIYTLESYCVKVNSISCHAIPLAGGMYCLRAQYCAVPLRVVYSTVTVLYCTVM
jgi:hypothetical protein